MVVAFEPPPNVTTYIQSRGRARQPGSTFCWMVPKCTTLAGAARRGGAEAAEAANGVIKQQSKVVK